ncbi:MAG: site-specific integrase [Xanthomonadales bacterium]|nr:site-specific integrase [Xanthomonadales bacterium]
MDGLVALINQLHCEDKPLMACDNQIWCDIELDVNKYPANVSVGNQNKCIRRWFPDHESLMWINQILLNKKSNQHFKVNNHTPKSLWALLHRFLLNLSLNHDFEIGLIDKPDDFFKTSFAVTDDIREVEIPQYLIDYSNTKISSTSLQPTFWNKLIKAKFKQVKNLRNKKKLSHTSSVTGNINIKKSIARILENKKLTKQETLELLHSVNTEDTIEDILKYWIIHNLEDKGNKKSSANTYLSNVSKTWLRLKDLSNKIFDRGEVNSFFQKLEEQREQNDNPFRYEELTQLKQLYQFGEYLYDLPEIPFFSKIESKSELFINTGIISEQMFVLFINEYKEKSPHSDLTKKMMISCFIIFFRCGLRISELNKIRIRDVEIHDEDPNDLCSSLWIYIRNNNMGQNKSRSGYRRVPLGLLLKEEEKNHLINYINIKKQKANINNETPLFSWDFSSNKSVSRISIYNIFREYLSNHYDLTLVVHIFRHTAISRLYAILTNDSWLISKLSSYNKRQEYEIRNQLRLEGKDGLWSLAKFSGHSTPENTLKYYIHFADYHLYSVLSKRKENYNKNQILIRSGCSSQYLTYYLKKYGFGQTINLTDVKQMLKSSISPFCKKLRKSKEIDSSVIFNEINIVNYSTQDIYYVLQSIEKGNRFQYVSTQFKIELERIRRWAFNAKILSEMKNKNGGMRFVSKRRKKTSSGHFLCPTMPQTESEMKLINDIFNKSRAIYKKNTNNFNSSIQYFVENSTYSSPFLVFSEPIKLYEFLSVIKAFFKTKDIILEFSALKTSNSRKSKAFWNKHIENQGTLVDTGQIVNQNKKYPHGRIVLKILHPDNEELLEKANATLQKHFEEKIQNLRNLPTNLANLERLTLEANKRNSFEAYHTNVLKFVFHMFAIEYLNLKK